MSSLRLLLPEAPSEPSVQHAADVTGVQSAGVGAESLSQLLLQQPAALHLQYHEFKARRTGD